jgi:CRP/FNR family transcriptional regulator
MNDLPLLRRPVTINLTQRANVSSCDECGARQTGMCAALSEEDLGFLATVAQRVTIPVGDVFMEEGDKATYFYNLNQGNVRLFKSLPDGRRQITGFAGPGYFLALAQSEKYVFSAEAMDTVKLCRFNRVSLMAVFEEFPALERKLLDAAMHELVIAQQHMLLLGRKTAVERVASFLLSWAVRLEVCGAGTLPKPGSAMLLPLSRMDLADYLGLTIETVSRSLGQLKRDGLIDVPSIHEIILLKPKALSDIAEAV